jgi:hypothetical protein
MDNESSANDRKKAADREQLRKGLDEILHRVDSLPTIDERGAEEILGYDENGLPS